MMLTLLISGLLMQAAPVAVERTPLNVEVPTVEGVTSDPTCGGREAMAAIATCFATTQAAAEGVADTWNTAFMAQGWLPADGRENRVVYVRRKDGGGCDAVQLLAFAQNMRTPDPAAPAYLALANVPGDVCATGPAAPQGPPAQ